VGGIGRYLASERAGNKCVVAGMCAEPFDKLRTALVEAPFDKLRAHVISETTNGNPLSERRCFQQDGDHVPHF